ncbi:MAG: AI-2E family transporter [Candidatus Doudnabacteria bacterium]|nr:AI-2E family transporter [Candidatus Doudnabacteria bacterium]
MTFKELDKTTQVILKVVFAVLVLAFLWVVRDIIVILLLALILASAMDPMVDYFSERKIPRAVSVLTVYLLVLGLAGLVIYLVIPPVVEQFKILQANLPEYVAQLSARFGSGFVENFISPERIQNFISDNGSSTVVSGTFGVFSGVFTFITVLVISFYLVAEEQGMKKFIATLLPEHHHEFTMALLEKIQRKMGLWVLGQVILSFFIFVLTLIGLVAIGLIFRSEGGNPLLANALLLALLAGLLEVMPYIGPFLSAVPAVIIAFIYSPPLAIVVAFMYLLIQKTEGFVLVPKIMEKTVGTSPLAVLLALLIGYKLAGIIGLLIAVPLVSAITVVVNEFLSAKKPEVEIKT